MLISKNLEKTRLGDTHFCVIGTKILPKTGCRAYYFKLRFLIGRWMISLTTTQNLKHSIRGSFRIFGAMLKVVVSY